MIVPESLVIGFPLFEGRLIVMEKLPFVLLLTRHIISTPIAVVIKQAKKQVKKIFH